MKFAIGSNYGKDQSFVQASVHEDLTIEKDDSEDNDSHNTIDSYSTYSHKVLFRLQFIRI